MQATPTSGPTGRRELNKAQKRDRIRSAARELFSQNGYEATTMRAIAARADVGLGTLFSYADDKRDLIFLIANDNLAELAERGLAAAQTERSLIARIVAVFAVHYEAFAQTPTISRLALRELTFYSEGKQAAAFHMVRARLLDGIESIIRSEQSAGGVRADVDAGTLTRSIAFIYTSAVRWWIAKPEPVAADGIAELREMLALLMEGLRPQVSSSSGVAAAMAE